MTPADSVPSSILRTMWPCASICSRPLDARVSPVGWFDETGHSIVPSGRVMIQPSTKLWLPSSVGADQPSPRSAPAAEKCSTDDTHVGLLGVQLAARCRTPISTELSLRKPYDGT